MRASGDVERVLNGVRIAVLGLVLSFAATLGVEFGVRWWEKLLYTGVVTLVTLLVLGLFRKHIAALMHRVTGQ